MRYVVWVVFVIVAGLTGAALTVLITAGAIPPAFNIIVIGLIPLLCLGAAFFGLIASDSIASTLLVGLTALVFPIPDIAVHPLIAGGLDEARAFGLMTGLALTIAGAVSLAIITTKQKALTRQPPGTAIS